MTARKQAAKPVARKTVSKYNAGVTKGAALGTKVHNLSTKAYKVSKPKAEFTAGFVSGFFKGLIG